MIIKEYIDLINILKDSTSNGVIRWKRGESHFAYISQPSKDIKFLVDKYFSIANGEFTSCVNMKLFDVNDKIINEIVLCKLEDSQEEFELLDNLYQEVEKQFYKKENEKLSPILLKISQSLQQLEPPVSLHHSD